MNRLILIGNGFDLAHKMKTSYCDFITDYMVGVVKNFLNNDIHDDVLVNIRFRYGGRSHNKVHKIQVDEKNVWTILQKITEQDQFVLTYKSNFFRDSINKIHTLNWVDLENDYFENLLRCSSRSVYDINSVIKLNKEFDFIREELEKYLFRIQSDNDINISSDLAELFYETIKAHDIVTINIADHNPKEVMFLSFNYTDTIVKYIERYAEIYKSQTLTKINYIHGKLGTKRNPIIFGYGDEYNKRYLEFEDIRNKELLKHIKSFGYFKTSNYHDLLRFLNLDHFQVYILGHSLGVTDRTMLKQIFEHENCKSVKIFYHEKDESTNDYTDKTYDLASHFSDKEMMRNKIVTFDKSRAMPQPVK